MPATTLRILLNEPIGQIRPELYGHFAEHLGACVNEGIWVGTDSKIRNIDGIRADVVEALRRIQTPVIRWPGGCFADDYHWQDGIGLRESRPRTVNLWWGHSIENNHFGTHEFMHFCRLVGAKSYLAGNLGSGTVREMRDWIEYCNFPGDSSLTRRRAANGSADPFNVSYFGVGNEAWGCGGNFSPEEYAAQYKRFATYLRDYGEAKLFLVACGPDCGGQPNFHTEWTRRFMQSLDSFPRIHGLGAHYYCGTAGTATSYTTDQWYELLERASRMDEVITTHRAIMDEFATHRKIGLLVDEWGTWHPPTPGRNPNHLWQQNTMRDALVAGITLNIFNNHADKLVMCNIAQAVNVLQAMCLTDGDRLVLTPTYHVFDLFKHHQGARAVRVEVDSSNIAFAVDATKFHLPSLTVSASMKQDELTVSITNAHATLPQEIALELDGPQLVDRTMRALVADDITAHNTFDEPDRVQPNAAESMILPPASITVIRGTLK